MSLAGLLNQTITIYNRTSFDEYGRATLSSGTDVVGRFERHQKVKLLADGKVNNIEAICYIPAGTTVAINDKISYDGTYYKVMDRIDATDGAGKTHHIKLELIRWV